MANDFITPSVIANRGIATLYNTIVLAGLVWRDFDADFRGKQGDTVTARKPATFEAVEFDMDARTTSYQDADEDSIAITLDKLVHVPFKVTDEQSTLEIEDFAEQLLNPAMEAVAQKVDGDIAEKLVDTAEGVGGGGTATKGSNGADYPFRKAREILTRNKLPVMDRHAVISPEAVTDVTGLELIVAVDKSGSTQGLREGIIGRISGLETYESQVMGYGAGDRGQADGVAFHRNALILAMRPLETPRGLPSDKVARASWKNLAMRVIYSYDHDAKSDKVTIDVLYGMRAAYAEGAVQLSWGIGS